MKNSQFSTIIAVIFLAQLVKHPIALLGFVLVCLFVSYVFMLIEQKRSKQLIDRLRQNSNKNESKRSQ